MTEEAKTDGSSDEPVVENTENSTPPAGAVKEAKTKKTEPEYDGPVEDVRAAAIVYRNKFHKKVLSVLHLQRRLFELGYTDGYSDPGGYMGDLTLGSVTAWQTAEGYDSNGVLNTEQLTAIFDGDPSVRVVE